MSKIWKKVIVIPEWVEVKMEWKKIIVKWSKWELDYIILDWVNVVVDWWSITVSVDWSQYNNLRWLTRTLINNMIVWVSKWFEKKLLVVWVWYNAQLQWKKIILSLWLSHKVEFEVPSVIEDVKVDQDPKWNYVITLKSINKQKVWEVAAKIRDIKKPEPYKWKWIRYFDENVKIKPGKVAWK